MNDRNPTLVVRNGIVDRVHVSPGSGSSFSANSSPSHGPGPALDHIANHHNYNNNNNNSNNSSKPRIKRWAPRTKTGCVTCRHRRVKCDESKPICGQCVRARRHCAGPYYQDSAQPAPSDRRSIPIANGKFVATAAAITSVVTAMRRAMQAPASVRAASHGGWELVPAGWEVIECYEYVGTRIVPFLKDVTLLGTDQPGPEFLAAVPGSPNAESFLARVIADRIVFVSSAQNVALLPSAALGTAHLWERFGVLLGLHLCQINHDLHHVTGDSLDYIFSMRAFERIFDLMECEHVLTLPKWRAHFNGYFALLRMFGIPQRIPFSNPCFLNSLRGMIAYSVIGNSLSNTEHQHMSIYDFDDAQVSDIFCREKFAPFPCPGALFAEIVAINRLRLVVNTSRVMEATEAEKTARDILGRINEWDAETWRTSEKYNMPDIAEISLMARIFQLSVCLYAMLSLSRQLPDGGGSGDGSSRRRRIRVVCDELVALMRKASKSQKCVNVLVWPAAVAGAALGGGSGSGRGRGRGRGRGGQECESRDRSRSRQFITETLMAIDSNVLGYGITIETINRLRVFWRTQRTSWDECWNSFYLVF